MRVRSSRHPNSDAAAFAFRRLDEPAGARRKIMVRDLLVFSGVASVMLVSGFLILFGRLASPSLHPVGIVLAALGVALDVVGVVRFVLAARLLRTYWN